ncbi:PfkB family carbohydrate kinase [Paludibaculum fermentans]|uniref:Carbohydrate kinase PfkB domain-containing protein n=1 Tax=Paludibaculum fermentans TaxID=1473598 RepID=A0A7S7SMC1_PALFE|nr:PfkB family carbohydrate kinase [Paludibaculum fermentans]QOY90294.1 hypothetical protein IRI77_10155 [Paludibaculum fermentans]
MNARAILSRIQTLNVLVAGDLWLDRWSRYDPFLSSASPETGLESTVLVATETAPGGCGLSAAALAALGAKVALLAVVGDDGAGLDLRRALEQAGVAPDSLLSGPAPTPSLTRLIHARTGAEDAGRIEVVQFQPPGHVATAFAEDLHRLAAHAECVLVVEHRPAVLGGLVAPMPRSVLAGLAATCPLLWHETPLELEQLRGGGRAALIVRPDGQGGVEIQDGPERQTVPERMPEYPVDPHGARETFSAAAAAALAAGADPADAVRFALLAAAVCMMKPGARCASPEEILRAEREWSE